MNTLRVWDPAVLLFHWALLILFLTSVTTGLTGGNAMTWHERSGTLILGLLLFRWGWGLFGSTTARFSDFLHGPRRVLGFAGALLHNRETHVAGHNPLGGWMVLLLLLSLSLQAITGLFADDEIFTSGPLAHLVSGSTNSLLTSIHGTNAWVLIGLVVTHVAAVLFHHLARHEKLVHAMVTGKRPWPGDVKPPQLRFAPNWVAAVWLLLSLGAVFAVLASLAR
jgi:cytochrome b